MKTFQNDFLSAVLDNSRETKLLQIIKPAGNLDAEGVLQVYRRDYKARMSEALGANYEGTWLLLGDDEFFLFAENYVSTHPSQLTNLTNYGESFPEFLNSEKVDDIVVAMAQFERHFWSLFHAPDRNPVAIDANNVERIIFDLSGITLLRHPLRLSELWREREVPTGGLSLEAFEGEELLVLYKKGQKVEIEMLSELQFHLLDNLQKTGSISKLVGQLEDLGLVPLADDWGKCFAILSFARQV